MNEFKNRFLLVFYCFLYGSSSAGTIHSLLPIVHRLVRLRARGLELLDLVPDDDELDEMRAHHQHAAHDVAAHLGEEELHAVGVVLVVGREDGGVVLEEADVVRARELVEVDVVCLVVELDKRGHVLAHACAQPAHARVVLDDDHVEAVEVEGLRAHEVEAGVAVDADDGRGGPVEDLLGEVVEQPAHLRAVARLDGAVAEAGDDEPLQVVDVLDAVLEEVHHGRHDLLHGDGLLLRHVSRRQRRRGRAQDGQLVDAFGELAFEHDLGVFLGDRHMVAAAGADAFIWFVLV